MDPLLEWLETVYYSRKQGSYKVPENCLHAGMTVISEQKAGNCLLENEVVVMVLRKIFSVVNYHF